MFRMIHENYNVTDLARSIAFYQEALGLQVARKIEAEDFTIAFLEDEAHGFQLELTWMHNRAEPYQLGDNEFHLAFETDDFAEAYKKHEAMGCICYENAAMGIYFINDPDGYWLEIVPKN